jgi:hypothetical protein
LADLEAQANPMDIAESYAAVSRFFALWVRAMEIHTRRAQASVSGGAGGQVVIISPPVDPGIRLLTQASPTATTTLVCFSEHLERLAMRYLGKRGIGGICTTVVPFFQLPFADATVRAIYANCFFDFCPTESLGAITEELWRVLEPGGALHAVYMAPARTRPNRVWAWGFRTLTRLSCGCHPVSITEWLPVAGLRVVKDRAMDRFGFPLRYTVAERSPTVT